MIIWYSLAHPVISPETKHDEISRRIGWATLYYTMQHTNHPLAIHNARVDVVRITGQPLCYRGHCSGLPAAPLACEQHVGGCAWITNAAEQQCETALSAIQ